MKNSLPYARFTSLLKAIENIDIPLAVFHQHRVQYHFILGQLCLKELGGVKLSVTELLDHPLLGSQPTAHKRIRELIQYGLLAVEVGADKRQRLLFLTTKGHAHLAKCSELMKAAFA